MDLLSDLKAVQLLKDSVRGLVLTIWKLMPPLCDYQLCISSQHQLLLKIWNCILQIFLMHSSILIFVETSGETLQSITTVKYSTHNSVELVYKLVLGICEVSVCWPKLFKFEVPSSFEWAQNCGHLSSRLMRFWYKLDQTNPYSYYVQKRNKNC